MTDRLIQNLKALIPGINVEVVSQGAEAVVFKTPSHPYYATPCLSNTSQYIIKYRPSKKYRHPKIDASLTKNRTIGEVKFMTKLEKLGIRAPSVILADYTNGIIWMEHLGESLPNKEISSLKNYLWYLEKADKDCTGEHVKTILTKTGELIGRLHNNDMIHGDLTSSNILLNRDEPYLIDFGLSSYSGMPEDKAVDIYVLERAIQSTHSVYAEIYNGWLLSGYKLAYKNNKKYMEVINRLDDVRQRGRKRSMLG